MIRRMLWTIGAVFRVYLTVSRGNGLRTTGEACTSTPPWFTQLRGSLGRMISLHSRSAPFCMRRSRWKHDYELMSFLLMTLSPIGMYFRAMEFDASLDNVGRSSV